MTVKRKILWITALIIITAIAVVLCFGLISNHPAQYDGTLVQNYPAIPAFLFNLL